jgi:molybdate transport system substrate-binding protein
MILRTRTLSLAAVALFVAACSREASPTTAAGTPPSVRVEVVVYAATSTRDALQDLEGAYERDHGVDLVFNFGSSGDLAKQIVAAAKADVFLSADEREMDNVEQARLLAPGTRRALFSNQLVVIEPADGATLFSEPFDAAQLASPRVERLSIGRPETVPAGRYAKAWLRKVGVWDRLFDRVLPGVDVRAALAAVESAGAQAGIVYSTDAAMSRRVRVVHAVPLEQGPRIVYPVAVIVGRPSESAARGFVEYLGLDAARAVFEARGFAALPAAAAGR